MEKVKRTLWRFVNGQKHSMVSWKRSIGRVGVFRKVTFQKGRSQERRHESQLSQESNEGHRKGQMVSKGLSSGRLACLGHTGKITPVSNNVFVSVRKGNVRVKAGHKKKPRITRVDRITMVSARGMLQRVQVKDAGYGNRPKKKRKGLE